jgi:anti-sigma B factor antagonist
VATESDERGRAYAALRGGHAVRCESASFFLQGLDGSTVVVAAGEIDVATSPALREALRVAAELSSKVIVDLSAVTFLDSTGLGVLMGGFKTLSADGSMCLVGPTGMVAKVLRITRLDEVIPIHADADAAVSASHDT